LTGKKRIMNKVISALLGLSILLTACPYESEIPIDLVENGFNDSNLIGKWKLDKSDSEESINQFLVLQFNKNEYLAQGITTVYTDASLDESTTVKTEFRSYRIFLSKITNIKFINVQPLSLDKEAGYIFYKYEIIDNKTLRITEIADGGPLNKTKFGNSESLRKYITENLSNENLWGDTMIYTKIPDVEAEEILEPAEE